MHDDVERNADAVEDPRLDAPHEQRLTPGVERVPQEAVRNAQVWDVAMEVDLAAWTRPRAGSTSKGALDGLGASFARVEGLEQLGEPERPQHRSRVGEPRRWDQK